MRLMFRLTLTILSLLLILTACYLTLPSLLASFARYQLTQQGFVDIEIQIDHIGLQSATVKRLQMFNDEFAVKLQGLHADYQLSELLSGIVDSIRVEHITVSKLPAVVSEIPLPDASLLLGFLKIPWHETMPVRSFAINNLIFYDKDDTLSLHASGELHKQGQRISGEINLMDSRAVSYLMSLEVLPETGFDLQLHTLDENRENPLSATLQAAEGMNGLTGEIKLNLSGIAELIGAPENLSGLLQADVSYFADPGTSNNNFTISAVSNHIGVVGWQIEGMTVNLIGNIDEHGNGYRLGFSESSRVTLKFLQQGQNKVQKLALQLPQSLEIVNGALLLSSEQGADIQLSKMILDNISIPEAQLNNITFKSFSLKKVPDHCMFKMQLTAPIIEIKNIRIELTPMQLDGVCPERKEMKWWINASAETITYEDESYQLPLNRCHLTIGNSEKGKLLDENPAELGGSFLCRSSRLSGKLSSRFRFNPITGVGRASYSIPEINLDNEKPLLNSLLKDWKGPFDIVSGALSVEGTYRWWKTSRGQGRDKLIMDFNVIDAGGYYQDVLFSGLNYEDSIELLPALKSSEFSELTVSHIDIGIPISSVFAKIRFGESTDGPSPLLTINDLVLSLFDGKVKGNDLIVDMNADEQDLELIVAGLDLTKIVDLQGLDGLSATGRLDGIIPVTITPKGIKITAGTIVAQEQGGRIQYKPLGSTTEIEESALGSELVLRILEDLKYDSLNIDVDYEEDGEMEMKLAIEGMSPKVDARRPVHFKLNLQQNVLTLLQGLRYAEGINKDIDRNVQKYFSKEKN